MSPRSRSWAPVALISVVALTAGYTLPRPAGRGADRPSAPAAGRGDMLDAVAIVQRRSPRFLVSEPMPSGNWTLAGALYLCRTPRTAADVDGLSKHPSRPDPQWAGVVCFHGTADPNRIAIPWVSDGGDRCLRYGRFAVFGDPELLAEVRAALAAEGIHPVEHQ